VELESHTLRALYLHIVRKTLELELQPAFCALFTQGGVQILHCTLLLRHGGLLFNIFYCAIQIQLLSMLMRQSLSLSLSLRGFLVASRIFVDNGSGEFVRTAHCSFFLRIYIFFVIILVVIKCLWNLIEFFSVRLRIWNEILFHCGLCVILISIFSFVINKIVFLFTSHSNTLSVTFIFVFGLRKILGLIKGVWIVGLQSLGGSDGDVCWSYFRQIQRELSSWVSHILHLIRVSFSFLVHVVWIVSVENKRSWPVIFFYIVLILSNWMIC